MPKILFICHANVGRSQMAEAYYNHYTCSKDGFSAGNLEDAPNRYPRLPPQVTSLMREEGIDVSYQKPKLVTKDMVDLCDKMYVMCEPEQCLDFVVNSDKAVFWKVTDPYNMTIDEMREIRDLIKEKVRSIL